MRGYKGALLIAISLASVGGGSAGASLPSDDSPQRLSASEGKADSEFQFFRQQLAAAHAMARSENYSNANRTFDTVIGDRLFADLPSADQRAALSAAASTAVQLGESDRGRNLYLRATALDDSDPDDWYRLSLLEFDLENYDASAAAFTQLAERWPELLPNVNESYIHSLRQKLSVQSPARLKLLQSLFDANWSSKTGGASSVWYDLAIASIERGDQGAAQAAIKRIESPLHLVRLRSDKRFDALVNADAWAFDVEHRARRQVEKLQEQAAISPSTLDIKTQLSYAMLTAGMHEEVIKLADDVIAAIANAPPTEPPFTDIEEQVWLMNNRAAALRRIGRTDEALADLVRASRLTESGGINVSQALNLGYFYCSLGRPDDALGAIAEVGNMSGYGLMVQKQVLHCAALQKGDKRGASRAMAYLRSHREEGRVAYLDGLLRANQVDEAAKAVRELVASADERGDILEWLQDYRRPEPLPGDIEFRNARKKLLARVDVQDAVAQVGRLAHYEVYGDNSTD